MRQGSWDIVRGAPPFVDERRGIDLAAGSTTTTSRSSGSRSTSAPSAGKQLLRQLVAISDVVTENFAAGVLARMGFPWEELQAIKPDIVYVSNCGFGATGPELGVQDVGSDRAGGVGPHLQLGAGGRTARGLGLLLHGPHGRGHDGGGDPRRAHPPQPHRSGPVDRHGVHRGRHHAGRARPPRLHGQRPPAASPRPARLEPQSRAGACPARHLPVGGRRQLDRHRVP